MPARPFSSFWRVFIFSSVHESEGKGLFTLNGFSGLFSAWYSALRQAIAETRANVPLCSKCRRMVMLMTIAMYLLSAAIVLSLWRVYD